MAVFFLVAWTVALIFFLVVPAITNPQVRRRWYYFFRYCEWPPGEEENNSVGDAAIPEDQFHYRLSRPQEEEILESFLVETLSGFTKTVEDSDIRESSRPATAEGTQPSGETDLEVGLPPTTAGAEKVATPCKESDTLAGLEAQTLERFADCGDESDSEGNDDNVVVPLEKNEFATEGFVTVPTPGTLSSDENATYHEVPRGCAICLSALESSCEVSWSANVHCSHVFHKECIFDWLKASGRRQLRKSQQRRRDGNIIAYSVDPITKITDVHNFLCPCCRRVFVPTESSDVKDSAVALSRTESEASS